MQNRQRHIALCLVLAAALALSAPAAAGAWTWPVEGPVLQSYVFDELNPKAPGQHRGISIGAAVGTPVRAPVGATITFAGTVPSGGKTLSLLMARGLSVTLLHLGSFDVVEGMTVAEGEVVGTVGPSAGSEIGQPFVYLGVRRVEDPQGYLDPMLFLPPPAVEPRHPVVPPAPEPAPAPAPGAAPVAVAPPAPPAVQLPLPRFAGPADRAPVRPAPSAFSEVPDLPAPSPQRSDRPSLSSNLPPAHLPAITPPPARGIQLAPPAAPPAAPAPARPAPIGRGFTPTWLRPLDLPHPSATSAGVQQSAGATRRPPFALLAATLAALALVLLFACRGRGGGARIIGGDALLPDNADLLREREPAYRARVHDDRRGRSRPAPQAAR